MGILLAARLTAIRDKLPHVIKSVTFYVIVDVTEHHIRVKRRPLAVVFEIPKSTVLCPQHKASLGVCVKENHILPCKLPDDTTIPTFGRSRTLQAEHQGSLPFRCFLQELTRHSIVEKFVDGSATRAPPRETHNMRSEIGLMELLQVAPCCFRVSRCMKNLRKTNQFCHILGRQIHNCPQKQLMLGCWVARWLATIMHEFSSLRYIFESHCATLGCSLGES